MIAPRLLTRVAALAGSVHAAAAGRLDSALLFLLVLGLFELSWSTR